MTPFIVQDLLALGHPGRMRVGEDNGPETIMHQSCGPRKGSYMLRNDSVIGAATRVQPRGPSLSTALRNFSCRLAGHHLEFFDKLIPSARI
jgi:hypothetical protein